MKRNIWNLNNSIYDYMCKYESDSKANEVKNEIDKTISNRHLEKELLLQRNLWVRVEKIKAYKPRKGKISVHVNRLIKNKFFKFRNDMVRFFNIS